jgi:hypothetical protein
MTKYLQGKYIVRNKKKYIGDHYNVVYRSSWELKFLAWCDNNPNVVEFSSEEIVIPYKSPVDGKYHRYFVDCFVKVKDKNGNVKSYLIEIKPKKQTQQPTPQRRVTKRYITEVTTWGINQAKWKAATEYCLDRNWEFKLITEDHLGL